MTQQATGQMCERRTIHHLINRSETTTTKPLQEVFNMGSKSIESIEGIGPAYGAKLRDAGCASPAQLLKDCATRKGRQALAEKTGISDSIILRCVNMADLFRISGVATQYAELLEAAGVDTVKELRNRNAGNLADKMREANAAKRLTRTVPSAKVLSGWIEQARKLPAVVSY